MKTTKIILPFILFITLIIPGCPVPDSTTLLAPANVDVNKAVQGNDLVVDWDSAGTNLSYDVYRVTGSTETLIPNSRTSLTYYYDKGYPVNQDVRYKVRSVLNTAVSGLSQATRAVNVPLSDLMIENLIATRLEITGGIRITWDNLIQGGVNPRYTLKRYITKANFVNDSNTGTDAVFTHTSFTSNPNGTVTYFDATALVNIPYYYIVDWVDADDGTNGINSEFVFGIYGDKNDHNYEKNDDWHSLPLVSTSFPPGTQLQIYKFDDEGVTDQDIDWYIYRGVPANIRIAVISNNSALVGNVNVDFFYGNSIFSGGLLLYSRQEFIFDKSMFSNPSSTVPDTLYFRLSPAGGSTNFLETYSLEYK
jgi:hypothetical protein